jgi:hypothetical protein
MKTVKPESAKRKMSVEAARALIGKHRIKLTASCADVMKITREVD